MTTRRLPRAPHAERPRADESVRKRGGVDLQNGWLSRHGTLYLTDERLVFVPTLLDTAMRAKRRQILLDELEEIERFPVSPDDLPRGGRRPRLILHAPECAYEFMVGDLDAWIDALEVTFDRRIRNGRPHRPRVTREGSTTALLDET